MQTQNGISLEWFFYAMTAISIATIPFAFQDKISWVATGGCISITLALGAAIRLRNKAGSRTISKFRAWRVDRTPEKRCSDQTLGLIGDSGEPVNDNEWEIRIKEARGKGFYGPYIPLDPGKYRVIFHLKVDSRSGSDVFLAFLDVTSGGSTGQAKWLARRDISSWDFLSENKYQEFRLDFQLFMTEREVEFRLRTDVDRPANRRVTFDCVELKRVR